MTCHRYSSWCRHVTQKNTRFMVEKHISYSLGSKRIKINVYVYININIYIQIYLYYIKINIYIYTYRYICNYIRIRIYIYAYTHIHIQVYIAVSKRNMTGTNWLNRSNMPDFAFGFVLKHGNVHETKLDFAFGFVLKHGNVHETNLIHHRIPGYFQSNRFVSVAAVAMFSQRYLKQTSRKTRLKQHLSIQRMIFFYLEISVVTAPFKSNL